LSISSDGKYVYAGGMSAASPYYFCVIDVNDPNKMGIAGYVSGASLNGIRGTCPSSIDANIVYAVAKNGGYIICLDVNNPTAPGILSSLQISDSPSGTTDTLNIKLKGNYALVTDYLGNELIVVDISNPRNMSVLSRTTIQLPNYLAVSGNYAIVSSTNDTNEVVAVDITDLNIPVVRDISSDSLSNTYASGVVVDGDYAFVSGRDSSNKAFAVYDINWAVWTSDHNAVGKIDGALSFDGDDYVDTGQTFLTTLQNDFTISMWVKSPDITNFNKMIFMGMEYEDSQSLLISGNIDGTGHFEYHSSSLSSSLVIFSNNIWTMITVTVEQTTTTSVTMKLYANGILKASQTVDCVMSELLYLGTLPLGGNSIDEQIANGFSGILDDVRIYNNALTAHDILTLYRQGMGLGITNLWVGTSFLGDN